MRIKTLKRMMIGRTIAQKGEELSVSAKEGQSLVAKGAAVELESPQSAVAKPKTKAKASKDTTEDKAD